MSSKGKRKSRFKTGMFLLENITSGMYNDPLVILREYIQNSVDSIDLAHQRSNDDSAEIRIDLDPFKKRVVIRDNGQGIPANLAEEVLCSIGSSNKTGLQLRGFRGIGRLGGIAFSDKAVFRTKAEGESVESVQEWDCVNLRKIIGGRQKTNLSLAQVLSRITSFSTENQKGNNGSYFEVTLDGVTSFRNYLFDITRVERFLSQVAPVPFDPGFFKFTDVVESHLRNRLSHYRRYSLLLNGDPVFKPYKDYVRVTKGTVDKIVDIDFFDIKGVGEELIGVGWFGRREELLGSIARGDDCSGIRVRSGNIMIGDNHLLDGCFREDRFNNYIPGEIHIESADLIPNSRRDDFVDNKQKNLFYNGVERELGLPISKEIRLKSKKNAKLKALLSVDDKKSEPLPEKKELQDKPVAIVTKPDMAESDDTLFEIYSNDTLSLELARKIIDNCAGCKNLQQLINKSKG